MTAPALQQKINALLRSGRLREALALVDAALQTAPRDTHLLQQKAAIAWQAGDLYTADDCLRMIEAAYGGPRPETDLMTAQLALDLLEFDRAGAAIERLLACDLAVTHYAETAVRLFIWQGDRDRALSLLHRALQIQPDAPGLLALQVTHDRDASSSAISKATRLAAELPDAHPAKTGLLYPLARYHDRIGDPEQAWQTMLRANALTAGQRRQQCTPDAAAQLQAQLIARGDGALARADAVGAPLAPPADVPPVTLLYLVGAPRTGSSLLQSILAAHPGVQSAGERGALLPFLNPACYAPAAATGPTFLQQVQSADLAGLQRAGLNRPVLVDKTTHNFFIAPLIGVIHRQSSFLNVVRRPQDIALSMLFHDFPPAFPESLWLDGIIAMLSARTRLLERYIEAGFPVATVSFDAFTQAPSVIGERIAHWAGLDWDAHTLDPARRVAAVPTFSAGQVRQPITPTPATRWQRFAGMMTNQQRDALEHLALTQTDKAFTPK